MSLQSDFELCLEYAEKIESAHLQRVQAQNNIIFMQNNSNRLKNKLRLCTAISALSAIILFVSVIALISTGISYLVDFLPILVIPSIAFVVSFFNLKKTKTEFAEFESKKPFLIQQYTTEAEDCEQKLAYLVNRVYIEELFDIVPKDYFSVAAIEFCLDQIRKKLANTATEAFQQLDAEIKRLEQMEYLEQLNDARAEQLNEIKRAIDLNTLVTIAGQNKYNR